MSYHFSTLCYIRFLSGLFALILVSLLWSHRNSKGVLYLILFEIAAAVWATCDGFESAALTLTMKTHWAQFAYVGISVCSVMFLMFSLSYTNQIRYVNRKTLLLLLGIPILTLLIAFVNPLRHLLWSKTEILNGSNQIIYYYGPYFWIQAFYQYSLLILGIIILLAGSQSVYRTYKARFIIIIIGALFPFLSSIVYVFKLLPVKGFDPTPISFILSGFILTLGIFWFRMFNILPLARKEAIDNLRDGMLVVDSAKRIVDANATFFRMTGFTPEKVIGTPIDALFAQMGIDQDKFTVEFDYVVEIKLDIESEIQDIEVQYQLITDENKRNIGGIYMFTNITTRKMILDAIADSNKSRKIELIEKEKLILDLDAYARSVAHDLKNPIGSLVSLTDLIKLKLSENALAEVSEMIGYVQDQSLKMIGIIDGLLMLSRIRKEDIEQIPIDTAVILTSVFTRLDNEVSRRSALIEKPEQWPIVKGHPQWIEEVWMNLISNALKYGGKPPVIKLGFDKETVSSYRFWIKDNGNGLPEASLLKIFRDFERLGVMDTDGFGLGLPIVKRIFEKLGTRINVSSANMPGEGCVFSFTLNTVP